MTKLARAIALSIAVIGLTGCTILAGPPSPPSISGGETSTQTSPQTEVAPPADLGEPLSSNDVADILRERFNTGVMPNLSSYPTYLTIGWHDCTFGVSLPENLSSTRDIVTVSGRYGEGWFEDYRVPMIDLPEVTVTFDELTPEFISANYDTDRCGP